MHTPGPWEMWERTQFDESQHQQCVCICDDAGDDAGDLHEMAIIKGHNHAANARLIAAAPELLGELQAMRDQLYEWAEFDFVDPAAFSEVADNMDRLIAKAEGRADA